MSIAASARPHSIQLALEGMTCASCAARIERKLNRLDGVEATVNFATEQATVEYETGVGIDDLVDAVESAGYYARPVPTELGERLRNGKRPVSAPQLEAGAGFAG